MDSCDSPVLLFPELVRLASQEVRGLWGRSARRRTSNAEGIEVEYDGFGVGCSCDVRDLEIAFVSKYPLPRPLLPVASCN